MKPNLATMILDKPLFIVWIWLIARKNGRRVGVRTIENAVEKEVLENKIEKLFPEEIVVTTEFNRKECSNVSWRNGKRRESRRKNRCRGRRSREGHRIGIPLKKSVRKRIQSF